MHPPLEGMGRDGDDDVDGDEAMAEWELIVN